MAARAVGNRDSPVKTSTPVRKAHALPNAAGIDFGLSPITKTHAILPSVNSRSIVNATSLGHDGLRHSFSSILSSGQHHNDAEQTDAGASRMLHNVQRLNRLLSGNAFAQGDVSDGSSHARDAISKLTSHKLPFTGFDLITNPIGSSIDFSTAESDEDEDSDDTNNADATAPEFNVKKLFSYADDSAVGASSNGANADFVDAVTSRRSRFGRNGGMVYASKRSRLSARAVKVLQSLSEQLDRQRNDNRSTINSLKVAASALSKAAQTDNVYAQKLHQHMSVFNEELYNQQSLSSEWQIVRKRCETSITALNELERILAQLTTFRINFIDQAGSSGTEQQQQQQLYLNDERMRSLVAALHETLESRNYIQALVEGGAVSSSQPTAIVANVDEMLTLATSTVLRYLRSALSDSEIKPVLLLDAVENDLNSELGLASQTSVGGVAQDEAAMQQELLAKSRPVELIDYSQSTYRMLKQSSSWLHKAYSHAFGRSFDHISLYYQIRSQVMTRSLQDFIRYVRDERSRQFFFAHTGVHNGATSGRSASIVNGQTMQRGGKGGAMLSAPSEASLISAGNAAGTYKPTTLLRSKFRGSERSGFSTATTAAVGAGSQQPTYSSNSKYTMPYDEAVHEVDAFLLSAKAYLKLVQVELLLCNDLIESQDRNAVFERIISVPMAGLLVENARRVVKQVSALHDGVDSQSLLLVLQALHHIDSLTTTYQQLLAGVSPITYTKWIDIVSMFEASGLTSIDLFVDKLRKMDSTTSAAPPDGAVHELTIRTVNLLNGLNQWKDECSRLLTNRAGPAVAMLPTANSPPHIGGGGGGSQKTSAVPVFSNFLATMLASVNSTVITRSHLYSDPFLAAIFRLNNHHYILRTLRNGTLVREIERAEPKIERIFEEQIVQAEDDYKRCWSPLMLAMHDLLSHPVTNKPLRTSYDEHKVELSAKDREMMKQRCTTIKRELDELYKRQVKYKISDQTLREVMIDNIMSMVLTQFKVFYENYKLVEFTSNRQKYMPYTPQHVETMIKQFFSGESYEFANRIEK